MKLQSGFDKPIRYDFDRWGWLGNEYLKLHNFRLPSWNMIQDAIIKEQIRVCKTDSKELKKNLEELIGNRMSDKMK